MSTPVDLTNLRSMTDGDKEMEKALFEEFFSSFEAGMASLQANMGEATAEAWRKEAHALKGIALNLGAKKLGDFCKEGQDNYLNNVQAKASLFENIHMEYGKVHQFLVKIMSA